MVQSPIGARRSISICAGGFVRPHLPALCRLTLLSPTGRNSVVRVVISMAAAMFCNLDWGRKRSPGVFSLLPFVAAIAVLLAWRWSTTIAPSPSGQTFESLSAFNGFLQCADTAPAFECLGKFRNTLLWQCKKLLSRSGYAQFHQCLGQLLLTQTEMQLAVSAQQCFHAANLRDLERRLEQTPVFWGLVVVVVLSQTFSVACVSFIAQTHQRLAIALAHPEVQPTTKPAAKPTKRSETNPTQTITSYTPTKAGSGPSETTTALAHVPDAPAWTHAWRAAAVSESRPDPRTDYRAQKLHMPTLIVPVSDMGANQAQPPSVDENIQKPSFNISTPEGRFQMKQYVRKQLERTQGAKL